MTTQTFEQYSPAATVHERQRRPENIGRGLIAGAAAGFTATLVMTLFQNAMAKMREPLSSVEKLPERMQEQDDSEPATVKAADALWRLVAGREVKNEHKEAAGQVVHYGFGTSMGMLYGVAAEYSPAVTAGQGSAFGTALMIGADEITVPLAGLGDPPHKTPLSTHLNALIAHIVFGVTCEQVRRFVRHSLD